MLKNSEVFYEFKDFFYYKKCLWIVFLISYYSNHRCGRDQTLTLLRKIHWIVWIVKAESAIYKVFSKCSLWKPRRSITEPQPIENLPKYRIALFKPPFTIIGVNYFGPVTIKQYKQTRTSINTRIWSFIYVSHRYGNSQVLNDITKIHNSERWTPDII